MSTSGKQYSLKMAPILKFPLHLQQMGSLLKQWSACIQRDQSVCVCVCVRACLMGCVKVCVCVCAFNEVCDVVCDLVLKGQAQQAKLEHYKGSLFS